MTMTAKRRYSIGTFVFTLTDFTFGILALIGVVEAWGQGAWPSVCVFLIAASLFLFPIRNLAWKRTSVELGRIAVATFFLIIGLASISPRSISPNENNWSTVTTSPTQDDQKKQGYERAASEAAERQYLNDIQSSIKGLGTFKNIKHLNFETREDIDIALDLDDGAVKLLQERSLHSNLSPDGQRVVADFRNKIIAFQTQIFPRLRADYGRAANDVAWAQDAKVQTLGEGHRTIRFTSVLFAAHQNILRFSETVDPLLLKMRFKTEQYQWAESLGDLQSRNLDGFLSDRDIVIWNGDEPTVLK